MRHTTYRLILMLLAALLPTAWVSAIGTVKIAAMQHGTVVASHTAAEEGETVTLTIRPVDNYLLNRSMLTVEPYTDDGEGDHASFARLRAPRIVGSLPLEQTSQNVFTFVMPAVDVLVSADFVEQAPINVDDEQEGGNVVTLNIEPDYDTMTATINQVSQLHSQSAVRVHIPSSVTDVEGNVFAITQIAGYAFYGMSNVTDIYLPETTEKIVIEEGAFLLDGETGSSHKIAAVHVPFPLLDDYALMEVFSENYEASKMIGSVTATHRYRTASCGVDIQLPASVRGYIAYAANGQVTYEALGSDVVKANNGVLLEGTVDGAHSYEVTAIPSVERPSGITPPTENAQSYANNQLVPVIQDRHFYAARNYYVLHNNQFYPVLLEDADKCCPSGRAVLRIK